MKKQAMNPYLPLWEYIPDGEPRVFDNRLYVYGSHDMIHGELGFCPGDYMVYSAPIDDLGNFRCDGVALAKSSLSDADQSDVMAAPDVVRGLDGKYYMYLNMNRELKCRVCVADYPWGPFKYLGCVQKENGEIYQEVKMFDPGVLVDEEKGKVYLYIGFCLPGEIPESLKKYAVMFSPTSLGFELASDMMTIIGEPSKIIPGAKEAKGTSFEGHGIYEASSPRKINGKYVMVYSSELSHDLAYALADEPLGPYEYKGVLVSNCDYGYHGNTTPTMPYGNTHGGLVEINKEYYIFYHRQTNGIECCRQGCAEKLTRGSDGWFEQAEITSCGLNGGPLKSEGTYNACYCCLLQSESINKEKLTTHSHRRDSEPHIYEEIVGTNEQDNLHYLANINAETLVGYKYFEFSSVTSITLNLKGERKCVVDVLIDDEVIGSGSFELNGEWNQYQIKLQDVSGVHALYFKFKPSCKANFESFTFA